MTDAAEVTVWDEGVFEPGQPFITSLVKALDRFDFAVLVLMPEDKVFVREIENQQLRDNLMFELGLLMGRLGPARTFMLCPSGSGMKLPSDLAGVTYLHFDPNRTDNNLSAAVRPAAQSIRKATADLGFSETCGAHP